MTTRHIPWTLSWLVSLPGCTNTQYWHSGVWVEEDIEVSLQTHGEVCAWAFDITEPEVPRSYILGDPFEQSDESYDDFTADLDDESLESVLSWVAPRSGDLWKYCYLETDETRWSIKFQCPVAIHLIQPDLALDAAFANGCDSAAETIIKSDSSGLLIAEGEIFITHDIDLDCEDDPPITRPNEDCEMSYSSWLRLE